MKEGRTEEGRCKERESGCQTHQSLKCLMAILGQLLSDLDVHQFGRWGGHSSMPLVLLGGLRRDTETTESHDVHQLERRLLKMNMHV